jgi:hypothetical protein
MPSSPFIRRAHQLATLQALPHALSFRVSIDYPDEAQHDAGRGFRNFRKALEGLRLLHVAGFAVGITRQVQAGENARMVDNRFRNLLRKQRLPEDMQIVALPELGALGADTDTPAPVAVLDNATETPCARSRMLLRRGGSLRFHACPLTDNADRFDVGPTLTAAMQTGVVPDHARCTLCLNSGVDYAGVNSPP